MLHWLVTLRGEQSRQAVADKIGMSQSGYASIETGARNPSVAMAKRIAVVLGFDWTRFFEDERQDSV